MIGCLEFGDWVSAFAVVGASGSEDLSDLVNFKKDISSPSTKALACVLFSSFPADGGAKLDKAMASGADAVIIDLEDPSRRSASRRRAPPRFLFEGCDSGDFEASHPGAHQRSRHRMTDADLDASVAGKSPTPSCFRRPKARNRRASRSQADGARAIAGPAEGSIKILAAGGGIRRRTVRGR